ncbi:hypothetical protein [Caproiciproducens faecalis]|uniref:AP2 domain-containing protein n=1 Tax=Caproiciproducens faecalis TaxID=2820301 RepID=A0ABS7DTH7_9FIRM|nr:hypothetical protein [Caproiciproducens faecalis]MBW7573886.1 hypothetical protein [Caproiciproducens faecalis]
MMKTHYKQDISGQIFGKLTVIKYDHSSPHRERYWLCKCSCGKEICVRVSYLLSGKTKSCGCDRPDAKLKQLKPNGNKYGTMRISHMRIYHIWQSMKNRCYSPSNKCYRIYGGRGITICDEWRNDFIEFCNWALNSGYTGNLTIDRIDNDKGYFPKNCRWITNLDQQRNKRNNKAAKGTAIPLAAQTKIS